MKRILNVADFVGFPKIARLSRNCTITEKLDGTNAQLMIGQLKDFQDEFATQYNLVDNQIIDGTDFGLFAGSRNKWIIPGKEDNYGFAGWARNNWEKLMKLGPGQHFGEWWGLGIQRGYEMKEKHFSLFNTHRWSDPTVRPSCCDCVPILYQGVFDTDVIDNDVLPELLGHGSFAAPGFMAPEGIIVYHEAANMMFKKTIKGDESPKGIAGIAQG